MLRLYQGCKTSFMKTFFTIVCWHSYRHHPFASFKLGLKQDIIGLQFLNNMMMIILQLSHMIETHFLHRYFSGNGLHE